MRNIRLVFFLTMSIILTACTLGGQLLGENTVSSSAEDIPQTNPTSISQENLAADSQSDAEALQPSLTPRATNTPWPSATPNATVDSFVRVGPDNFPEHINPLTGLPAPNPALLERRPIIAKIPNYPHEVRPQAGISLADHIYDSTAKRVLDPPQNSKSLI